MLLTEFTIIKIVQTPLIYYTIQPGDSLSRIAKDVYGSWAPEYYMAIYEANADVLNPDKEVSADQEDINESDQNDLELLIENPVDTDEKALRQRQARQAQGQPVRFGGNLRCSNGLSWRS